MMNETKVRHAERYWMVLAIALAVALAIAFQQLQLRHSEQSALISRELQLLQTVRYTLAEVSEAQNSAVLASAQSERDRFVAQAKSASIQLNEAMNQLTLALSGRRTPQMERLVKAATASLAEFQDLHRDLLKLATQNSNSRAYELAYGPMAVAVQTLDQALTQITENHTELASAEDQNSFRFGTEVRAGALRIYTLLIPHIAEEDDAKMSVLEASIEQEEQRVTQKLQSLLSLKIAGDASDLEKAEAAWTEFRKLRAEIIPLSRSNTNLRSARLALNERRAAMLAVEDSLAAIEAALAAEQHTSIVPRGR